MSCPPERFPAESGAVSAVLRPAAADPDLGMGTRVDVRYLATAASTSGEYGLYRWEMSGEATGPGAHFHRTISEAFYVLDGTVRLYDGSAGSPRARATSCSCRRRHPRLPQRVRRTRVDAHRVRARGAAGGVLRGAGGDRATGRELSPQEWTELYARHDQYMV